MTSTTAASTSWDRLYCQWVPGSKLSGSPARQLATVTVSMAPPVNARAFSMAGPPQL